MDILTGSGGILSYLQDILGGGGGGGFCPRQQKIKGGILSGGDFVLHSGDPCGLQWFLNFKYGNVLSPYYRPQTIDTCTPDFVT